MSATILVGMQAQAQLHEWTGPNGTGVEIPPVGPVTFASDNVAIASVDPNTGVVTGMDGGTCNITGTDAGNGLSASDSVTVAALAAASATLTITPLTTASKPVPVPSPK